MAVGDRIRQARTRARMSMDALSKEVGVSKTAISKYERGLDMPSSGVLVRLAKALGVRVEFFFRPRHALVTGLAYRKHPSLGVKDQHVIQAQIQDWLDRYFEIESFFITELNSFVAPTTINRYPQTIDEVEQITIDLRKEWAIGLRPIENMIDILEDAGIKVGLVKGVDGFDACTFLVDDNIPVIAVKEDLPGDRQRFSLAHELGHILLSPASHLKAEKVFHRFAGAFLAPEPMVRDELGYKRKNLLLPELYELKHRYGLSMQAWIHRAKELKIISWNTAKRLRDWFRDCGFEQTEPGAPVESEYSWRMERLVLRGVSEDIISEGRAAELLGVSLAEFQSKINGEREGLLTGACI